MKDIKSLRFVIIIIIIPIFILFLRFSIEQIIKININRNESKAQINLKTISRALENYALDHKGKYPADESLLINRKPPYLRNYYHGKIIDGYIYNLTLTETGYTLVASPVKCGLTAEKIYSITTGGVLTETACSP